MESSSSLEQAGGTVEENLYNGRGDTLYLSHCELNYVKQNEINPYFTLKSLGMEPFHLYKSNAQDFLGKLHCSISEGLVLTQKLNEGEKFPDEIWYETLLSENEDPKTNLRFRLMLVVSVFNGKPYLHMRNYVLLEDKNMWQPTKRGVRLAINESECECMKNFMDIKMKQQ